MTLPFQLSSTGDAKKARIALEDEMPEALETDEGVPGELLELPYPGPTRAFGGAGDKTAK